MIDVTDQALAHAEIRRQKQYFESLVEISPVAIVVMDADERVTGWNPAAAQLFGYSPQEAIGRADRRPRPQRGPPRRRPGRHPRGARERSRRPDHSSRPEGRGAGRRADDARAAQGRRRARRLLRDLPRHHRAPARTRARRDAPGRHAGARQDAEPRRHDRDDPRRAATSRALRQLFHPGDPGQPPGDRGRARPRRPRRPDRSGLRPGRRDQPRNPGRAVEAADRSSPTCRTNPHFASERARRWTHSRMDLRPDDHRRPRHRRPQRRQVRARLLQRRAGGARDGIRRPGRDGDRERSVARDRARRPRAGRDAPRRGRVAREHAGHVRSLRPDPDGAAQGRALPKLPASSSSTATSW